MFLKTALKFLGWFSFSLAFLVFLAYFGVFKGGRTGVPMDWTEILDHWPLFVISAAFVTTLVLGRSYFRAWTSKDVQ